MSPATRDWLVHTRLERGSVPAPARSAGLWLRRCCSSAWAKPMTSAAIACRSAALDRGECAHLQAQVAAVVDELAPELPGFPPAVVGVVVAKRDQEAEDQPVQNGRLGTPVDVGQMLELDELVHAASRRRRAGPRRPRASA